MAGSIVLTIALVLSFFSMLMYVFAYRGKTGTINIARLSYHGMTMMVIVGSALLLYAILTQQYIYKYVYSYSSADLSTGFLISTFWAGQEGSFMLWLFLTSLIGIFLQSYTAKRGELELRVMSVFTLATTFLLVMVSPLMKNPFEMLWAEASFIDMKHINTALLSNPLFQKYLFEDPGSQQSFVKVSAALVADMKAAGLSIADLVVKGKGLNPLLQNFWMQIHPPILFIGFALATVPFSFAIAALLKNDYRDWVKQSFPWILAQAGVLGLGIMLGGYWAYGVLGWGGYWAWDPVENSSLVPWLVSVAAIHTMLVQKKYQAGGGQGKFIKTNLILAMLVYILVLYSTFLTRSGILGDASVHSFVDPGMVVYWFLMGFMLTFLLLGLGLLFYRWKYLASLIESEENVLSRELALYTAAVALLASATIVIAGTSAPIFHTSVETRFYDEMHIPLMIIIGLLNGLSMLMKWKTNTKEEILKKSFVSLGLSTVFTLIIVFAGGVYNIMMILLAFSASFTLFVNGEIALKIMKGNPKMLGAYLAHAGIAIFVLGVIGSAAYSTEKDIDLVKGVPKEIYGYTLTFTDIHPIENGTKYAFNIDMKKGDSKFSVKPVMYISDFNQGMMREPDILSHLTKDFYVSPLGYDDGTAAPSAGQTVTLTVNEKTRIEGTEIFYSDFITPDMGAMMGGSGEFTLGAKVLVSKDGKSYERSLIMKKDANGVSFEPVEIAELNMRLQLTKIDPATRNADIVVSKITGEAPAQPKEILSVTASIKPFVNLVWLGVLVLFFGFIVSTIRRLPESRT